MADRAAGLRAGVARRARHALHASSSPTLHDDAEPAVVPGVGDHPAARARPRRPRRGRVSWEDFQRSRPALARAGVRFLASAGLALPDGAPRGEAYRRPPDLDDWLVLLEDYALRCLHAPIRRPRPASATPRSPPRCATSASAHAARDPPRRLRGRPAPDRLAGEGARARRGARPPRWSRAATPCRRSCCATPSCAGEARPQLARRPRPGGRHRRARADRASPPTCDRAAAPAARLGPRPALPAAEPRCCSRRSPQQAAEQLACRLGGRARRRADLAALVRRRVVAARVGRPGDARARERRHRSVLDRRARAARRGWDCPSVNCLVDLTVAAAGVSVRQMRGRSLRLDPDDPRSRLELGCGLRRAGAGAGRAPTTIASCAAPAPPRAGRRRRDRGRSRHVHPELGPFAPPPAERFASSTAAMRARAAATARRASAGDRRALPRRRPAHARRQAAPRAGVRPLRHRGLTPRACRSACRSRSRRWGLSAQSWGR